MRRLSNLLLVLVCLGVLFSNAQANTDRYRDRLEKLFIWKVSDELGLTPTEEVKFTKVIRKLGAEKRKHSVAVKKILKDIQNTKSESKLSRKIDQYKNHVKAISNGQVQEIDALKKVFGAKRLARYLILKEQFNMKLKSLLTKPEPVRPKKNQKLSDPKVIQED